LANLTPARGETAAEQNGKKFLEGRAKGLEAIQSLGNAFQALEEMVMNAVNSTLSYFVAKCR